MLLTNKYYDHKNFHIVCYLCVVHYNGISITCIQVYVYTSVFSHCTAPLQLKQFLKTFNHNVTLVYCKGD